MKLRAIFRHDVPLIVHPKDYEKPDMRNMILHKTQSTDNTRHKIYTFF
jgi:hypothetical protein